MADFIPFAATAQETTVRGPGDGVLTISSDESFVAIHGDLDIPPTEDGLQAAKRLRDILTATIDRIETGGFASSPDDAGSPVVRKKNPFG